MAADGAADTQVLKFAEPGVSRGPVQLQIGNGHLQEIGNAGFNDFVSNLMTGLGILGTFVGLIIGLQSFHPGSAEVMTYSSSSFVITIPS